MLWWQRDGIRPVGARVAPAGATSSCRRSAVLGAARKGHRNFVERRAGHGLPAGTRAGHPTRGTCGIDNSTSLLGSCWGPARKGHMNGLARRVGNGLPADARAGHPTRGICGHKDSPSEQGCCGPGPTRAHVLEARTDIDSVPFFFPNWRFKAPENLS